MSNEKFEILRLETELKNAMDYIADQAQEIEKLKASEDRLFKIGEEQADEITHLKGEVENYKFMSNTSGALVNELNKRIEQKDREIRFLQNERRFLEDVLADEKEVNRTLLSLAVLSPSYVESLKSRIEDLESRDETLCNAFGCELAELDSIEELTDTHSNLESRIEELENDVPDKRTLGALLYLAIPGCYAMENREELSRRVRECFPVNSISGQDVRDAIRWALERL